MSEHTPGPWVVFSDETVTVRDDKDGMIASLSWLKNRGIRPLRYPTEVHDNARLIAAAPDLLEEAEKLIDLHVKAMNGEQSDLVQWDSAVLNLRSAIAKAKGEQW